MPLTIPRKIIDEFSQVSDEEALRALIWSKMGNSLNGCTILFNRVLIAIYCRPGRTKSGLWMPDSVKEEDLWQSKVGLVLKMGPDAFADDPRMGYYFNGQRLHVSEWAVFKIGDTWEMLVNGVPCRLVEDAHIKMRVKDPALIY